MNIEAIAGSCFTGGGVRPCASSLESTYTKAAGEGIFRGLPISGLWEAVRTRPGRFDKVSREN